MCTTARFPKAAAQATSSLLLPTALAYDSAGNLYIADSGRQQVLEATLAGTLVVVAGSGVQGFAGDGGAASAAQLNGPQGVAVDSQGTVYIADTGNGRVRVVTAGVITTLAGNGQQAFGGDGGAPAGAGFRQPTALALDGSGNLLVCDTADHRVRRLGLGAGGLVSTVAGSGVQGFAGDGGPATAAELDSPAGVAASADGSLYLADSHNHRLRVVSPAGQISTFAGTGQRGTSGDGGAATSARMDSPHGLAMTAAGLLLVGDADGQRLRQITGTGVISTLAGQGAEGSSADGITATAAPLRKPQGVAVSPFGFLAVADSLNGTIRLLTPAGTLFRPSALAPQRAAATVQASFASAPTSVQAYGPLSLTLAVDGAIGTAQGAVSIGEGGVTLGSAALSGGVAAVSVAPLAPGPHTLVPAYGGDGLNAAVAGASLALQITTLSVTATANPATKVYGAALPALTGALQGLLPQDVGQISVNFATTAGALSPVGSYPITAVLVGPGSSNYALGLAAGSGALQITPAPSATSLSTVPAGYMGLPLRLAANVAASTQGLPTGTVQFLDGTTVVGTALLVNGSASAVWLSPSAGPHNVTAVYSGDGNFQASSSALQVATVSALPDFTLGWNGASSVTVVAGQSAVFSLLVGAQGGPFTGDVELAMTGLPTGASVAFSPVQVIPGAGSATVTVTVQTPAVMASSGPHGARGKAALAFASAVLFCGLCVRRKPRYGMVLSCFGACLFGGCLLLAGCGARTVGEAGSATSNRTFPLQVTGTSTNLFGAVVTHTVNLTLIVQQ